ncbi:MAG: O-antigen ligase domain-containing protein [Acidobacteria bacterium]|nr:MAG: O-antigen ligase domain-containing protein [Acidobacteriota bacterium]
MGARRVRLAVAGAAVLGAAAGVPFLLARFRAGDPFAVARLSIWPAALKALADAPWFGFGPGGFRSIAPAYAFPVDGSLVRYAKVFRGPHSDPLGLALAGGLPALLLAGVLAGCLLPRIWRAARRAPAQAGLLAGLAALAAHGLADDFLAERPAAALLAALFAVALIGSDRPRSEPRRPLRLAAALALAVWLGAGELRPYAADRALRAGDAELAAALDPLRDDAWLAALGSGGGGPLDRTASALEAARRAIAANRALPAAWRARALVLDASCRGPLAERITCEDALAAWGASLARLPRDVTARRGRARLEAALGRRGEAAADLALALAWEPAYLGALADLARLYEEAGQVEAAREEMAALEEAARVARGIVPASPYERAVLAPPEPPALRTGEPAGPERLTAPGRRP